MWIGVPAKYHSEARTLCGVSWRRRHAERAAEPARIVELPAKIKIILQTIYHAISRHLRARFAFLISSHQAKTQPNGWAIAWWRKRSLNRTFIVLLITKAVLIVLSKCVKINQKVSRGRVDEKQGNYGA